MSNVLTRVFNRLKYTVAQFKSDCHFSMYYGCLRIIDDLGGRLHLHKLSQKAHEKKDQWIMCFLKKELEPVITRYKDIDEVGIYQENAPIWICWWSGEDSAPPLVQQCIKSIRANANGHPVHLLDETTYRQYLEIPKYMLEKAGRKQIGLAHFSDYIRFSLLAKYGGLWLDATMFCASPLREDWFRFPFFTCKSPTMPCRYISKYRWTTFCIGGWADNLFFKFVSTALLVYWENHSYAIDYLFLDYIINTAYNNVKSIKKLIDDAPINNTHRDDLQAAMNAALPAKLFHDIIQSDTVLYKLSWRETYKELTEDGVKSVYGYFLDMQIGGK